MNFFKTDNKQFQEFEDSVQTIISNLSAMARKEELDGLQKLSDNFKMKTEDFFRENRKLNIGVVGQVKAGKSTFLNTLLFDGAEILPKASTPKTATLTKMEYSESNIIEIEYYALEEWEVLEENAAVDLDDEIYTSARELIEMARRNGIEPRDYLEKGTERIEFSSYDDLIAHLNDYVGEDGRFTPIVKAVTLYLNKEEFKGLSIVDTPGLNDPIVSRTIRTKEFMELCDVVFFLSQSGSFLDKSDWILLSSQLPQKGVKKLVLIASKYDSGIRDILRKQDEDDIFGEDENTADTIPKACKIIKRKLKKRARSKVEEFTKDLRMRESSPELIEVIGQCSEPILVSALAYNIANKPEEEFSSEEKNIYSALKQFSDDMAEDLKLLGNFGEVKDIFVGVVEEKENILQQKSKSFVPNAKTELANLLESYREKAEKRLSVLEKNDRGQLLEQKNLVENQINALKADIAVVFGELNAKLETEKASGIRELREAGKDYGDIQERSGTRTVSKSYTVSDSKWFKPWTWGKSHTEYNTYEKKYSYCVASDAADNLRQYSIEAINHVEKVFSDALQLKELKRKLLNVVVNNFDMGSADYDASLFRIMVEETISSIEFPVFNMDISNEMNKITAGFSGEITSTKEKTGLSAALAGAISNIHDQLSNKLTSTVKSFKKEMSEIANKVQDNLLENINKEFEALLSQCENKEKEIADYQAYIEALRENVQMIAKT